jgi:hypothetical protein
MDPRTEHMLAARRAREETIASLPRAQRLRATAAAWLARHRRSASLTLATLLGLVAGYYALVELPARARARRVAATREAGMQQAIERLDQGAKLDACLQAAQTAYAAAWDGSCRTLRRRKNCTLPSDRAQTHETALLDARKDCFKGLPSQ